MLTNAVLRAVISDKALQRLVSTYVCVLKKKKKL